MFMLSTMHRDGIGTEINLDKSQALLVRAANLGYGQAMYLLAFDNLKAINNEKAKEWLIKAAEKSNKAAIYLSAQLMESGQLFDKDKLAAAKLYRRAAFWQYEDSIERLTNLAKKFEESTTNDVEKQQIAALTMDIETITVHGTPIEYTHRLDKVIDFFTINSHYDGRSIRGSCRAINYCSTIDMNDPRFIELGML